MALKGPQWENTFWNGEDDEGNDVVHINDRTTNKVRTRTRSVEDAEAEGGTQQGMLFHPATGTGRRDDPLVSPERRRSAIEKSYGLSDSADDLAAQTAAEASFAATYKGRKALGKTEVKRNRELAIDAVDRSGLPIDVIENEGLNHPQVVTTDRSVGHRGTGTYSGFSHTAIAQNRVTEDWTREKVARATEGGDLAKNSKPLKVIDPYDDNAVHEIPGFPSTEDLENAWHGLNDIDDPHIDFDNLRHEDMPDVGVEHVFTSPGDPTKFVSEHLGQGYRGGYQSGRGYIHEHPDYYIRRKATAWEEEPTLTVEKKVKVRTPRPGVMAHELGHAYHLQGKKDSDRGRSEAAPDPLNEGVADGFEDHYHRYEDYPVDNIGKSPYGRTHEDRYFEETNSGEDIVGTSYSSRSSNWTNDTQRALYAAMRHAGAVTGKVPSSSYRDDTIRMLGGDEPEKPTNNKTTIYMDVGREENERRQAEDAAAWETDNAAALEAHADWEERSGAKDPNQMALGRLLYEQPDVLDLFRSNSDSKHVLNMRVAAATALTEYKRRVDANGGGMDVDPTDEEHGWKASPARVEQYNDYIQGMTLPLDDPETGEQYDNRLKRSTDWRRWPTPVFPSGGNPISHKSPRDAEIQ